MTGRPTEDWAEDLLRALEELRLLTGVDEWDEADWRTLAYCDAWEALGDARAYEVIAEVGPVGADAQGTDRGRSV